MKDRDDKRLLSGVIQVDDVYYDNERHGGKRVRGSENKIPQRMKKNILSI